LLEKKKVERTVETNSFLTEKEESLRNEMKLPAGVWKRFKKFRQQNLSTPPTAPQTTPPIARKESITDFVERQMESLRKAREDPFE